MDKEIQILNAAARIARYDGAKELFIKNEGDEHYHKVDWDSEEGRFVMDWIAKQRELVHRGIPR